MLSLAEAQLRTTHSRDKVRLAVEVGWKSEAAVARQQFDEVLKVVTRQDVFARHGALKRPVRRLFQRDLLPIQRLIQRPVVQHDRSQIRFVAELNDERRIGRRIEFRRLGLCPDFAVRV